MKPLRLAILLSLLLASACAETVPAKPSPEGWLSILGDDPALALSGSDRSKEQGWTAENPRGFSVQPSKSLIAIPGQASALRRDVDVLLLSTPYLTWRWRLDPGPVTGYAPLHLAIGFKTGSSERRLIVGWGGAGMETGRLERQGTAAFFTAQTGESDGNWREATLDISELHRLAWPDINTLKTRVTYVAIFTPAPNNGPAGEIEKLMLMR
ncbi:MAG: hypothetical protein EPN26_08050 [Rhodospirillales bacterium]|nr:MAG: hypothetical protein EPN26_08050 [Rhodospirillales bacterium]